MSKARTKRLGWLGWVGGLLLALATGVSLPLLTCRLPLAARQREMWIWGTQPPLVLHRYCNQAGVPDYCTKPGAMVQALENNPAGSACSGRRATDLDGAEYLEVSCPLREGDCEQIYGGRLWTERSAGTTADFALRGYGWLRRKCGAALCGSYDESAQYRHVANTASTSFTRFIRTCRPEACE